MLKEEKWGRQKNCDLNSHWTVWLYYIAQNTNTCYKDGIPVLNDMAYRARDVELNACLTL